MVSVGSELKRQAKIPHLWPSLAKQIFPHPVLGELQFYPLRRIRVQPAPDLVSTGRVKVARAQARVLMAQSD
jgi:hypothetical protein